MKNTILITFLFFNLILIMGSCSLFRVTNRYIDSSVKLAMETMQLKINYDSCVAFSIYQVIGQSNVSPDTVFLPFPQNGKILISSDIINDCNN